MALLDDLSNAANRGIGETQRVLELGRLKTQLGQLAKNRDDMLLAAGRTAYSLHRRSPLGFDELADVFARIQELDMQIVEVENQIGAAQKSSDAGDRCVSCGTVSPAGAAFCISCGKPMEKPQGRPCSQCGTLVPDDGAFCVRCGTRVEG